MKPPDESREHLGAMVLKLTEGIAEAARAGDFEFLGNELEEAGALLAELGRRLRAAADGAPLLFETGTRSRRTNGRTL